MNDYQIAQFHNALMNADKAKDFLKSRKFTLPTVKEFNIGFSQPAFGYPPFDLLNGRIIVPIYDTYGDIIAYSGRQLENYAIEVKNFFCDDAKSKFHGLEKYMKWKQAKWINTPYKKSKHLYNLHQSKQHIFKNEYCFIMEGYFDVMKFWQMGFKNSVALCGTSLSVAQCQLIFRYCKHVVFIMDGDSAGSAATLKNINVARSNHLFASVVQLPINTDPDDLEAWANTIYCRLFSERRRTVYNNLKNYTHYCL